MVSNIKCSTYNAPLAITVCNHLASLVVPFSEPRDKMFLCHHHIHNSYNLTNLALENDNKQPHARRTSIRDVIVKLK